jgi:hypothetical protein
MTARDAEVPDTSEALGTLASVVSELAHRARNALQRIAASVELARLHAGDRPHLAPLLDAIIHAEEELRADLDEIAVYLSPVRLKTRLCMLDAIWRQAWALSRGRGASPGDELFEEIDGTDLRVEADPDLLLDVLRRVFEHLGRLSGGPAVFRLRCSGGEIGGRAALRLAVSCEGPTAAVDGSAGTPLASGARAAALPIAVAGRIVEAHGGRLRPAEAIQAGAGIVLWLPRSTTAPTGRSRSGGV